MRHYVKSAPHFFRLIKGAFVAAIGAVLLLAALIPAPLLEPADPARVPNPVKSAWFLLWIQELVSYDKRLIFLVLLGALALLLLPWLLPRAPIRAEWFPRDLRWIHAVVLFATAAILILTIVAAFFRGENWSFVF